MKRYITIITLFAVAHFSYAQPDALPNPDVSFIAVIVQNIDTSLNWYSQILGFAILNETNMEGRGFRQANLKRGNFQIELLEISNSISVNEISVQFGNKARLEGFFKFGFQIDQFDEWVRYLESSRVTFHGKVVNNPDTGKRMVIIKDPDGNRIQLFEKSLLLNFCKGF